jgi:hypothetical protein
VIVGIKSLSTQSTKEIVAVICGGVASQDLRRRERKDDPPYCDLWLRLQETVFDGEKQVKETTPRG